MNIELREEEAEDRIRNGRAHDVEGKSTTDRKQVVVKRGKAGEKIRSGSPFSWSVPWVWQYQVNLGANSCQGLNPISFRGEQKVDKN